MYRYIYKYKQCPLKVKTYEEHSDDGKQKPKCEFQRGVSRGQTEHESGKRWAFKVFIMAYS